MRVKIILLILLTISCFQVLAEPFDSIPSSVPLEFRKTSASDLEYENKILLPDEAIGLLESGVIDDLSNLQPTEKTVLWKNTYPKKLSQERFLTTEGETLEVIESIPREETLSGQFVLRAFKTQSNNQKKVYRIIFDPKGHNLLLRKSLLEKIGYKIPAINHLRSVRLRFKGPFTKNETIKEITKGTFLESERWVVENEDELGSEIKVQNVFAIEAADDEYYNLALGVIPSARIRGRRLLNALLIPFNLVDVSESVNLFSWLPGRVFNQQLILDYEYGKEFSTTFEDAKWITKRILELSEDDWNEIVASADYPVEVELLVREKIKMRRNFLKRVFDQDKKFSELGVEESLRYGLRLQNSKLIGDEPWPGYASKFSGKDPDDPLSKSEAWSFLSSKVMTNVMQSLVSQFNKRFIPATDIGFKVFDHQLDIAAKQFVEFLKTGKISKTPFGFWTTKYWDFNLIAYREVIAGNYLGTNNIIQVADTIGFSSEAGFYIGTDGLPSASMMIDGQAKLNLYRTYTHLKPIKSIKSSLKEPFRNILVPLQKFLAAQPLKNLRSLELNTENRKELGEKASTIFEDFKKNLGIGESIIIQTGIGPELAMNVGYQVQDQIQAYLKIRDQINIISRIHILRISENTFHVYKDPAIFNNFEISFGLKAYIQTLEIGRSQKNGIATTEFYKLDFSLNLQDQDPFKNNQDYFDSAEALRRVIQFSKFDKLRSLKKPWRIDHDFNETKWKFDFLWFNYISGKQANNLIFTHPAGQIKNVARYNIGQRSGSDYQSFGLEVIDKLIDEYTEFGDYVTLRSTNSGNPSDTLFGKSESKQVSLESIVYDQDIEVENTYGEITYRAKGWSASPQKISSLFKFYNEKFNETLFNDELIKGVTKIRFYSVEISLSLYEEAIRKLLTLDPSEIHQAHMTYKNKSFYQKNELQQISSRSRSLLKEVKFYQQNKDPHNLVKSLTKLIHHLEENLTFAGFTEVMGGRDNLFVSGSLNGFKINSENGEREIYAQSIGRIGSSKPKGPLKIIQSQSGMIESEILLQWLMSRF